MFEKLSSQMLITPFPDGETVNSFLRRNAGLAGDCTLRRISRQLLARRPGLDGMPSRLDEFHARIGYLFGDRDTVAAKHTLLAYELLGVPPDRQEIQKARLSVRCVGPIRSSRLPVLLAPSEGAFPVCPACEEDAFDGYGFSFTHRRDVAPFVAACPVHFCWLKSSAQQQLLYDAQCQQPFSTEHLRNAIQFAMHSAACVEGDATMTAYKKASVIDVLRRARWLTDSDRLRLSELIRAFQSFFCNRFDDCRLNALVSTSDYLNAALRALMREDRAIHAVWCILLTWFSQHCEGRLPCNSARRHRVAKALSEDQVKTALSLHGTVVSAARELATSAHGLTIFCRCTGIPVDARPSKLDDSTLGTIRQCLAAGMRPQEVARTTQMSASSIYRVLAAMPSVDSHFRRIVASSTDEAKQLWLTHCEKHPNATQTWLRHRAPATFAVLHRNAPEWLKRQTPRTALAHTGKRARRSAIALSALARATDAACAHLDARDGPPVRRSPYRLRELLGINEYALKSSIARSELSRFSQTRDEYIAARVEWVTPRRSQVYLGDWRFARAAMLRQTTLRNWKARRRDEARTRINEQDNYIQRDRHQG
ncbi:TnsD family Tn7-like transposition protein [Paraburkholderia sediminicola]|uniref:TnsD family Tn7-like transposition protein n=1 Tax=Paraburkholderia sediminicola TaxID=458836 RepID=UPI0038BDDA5A